MSNKQVNKSTNDLRSILEETYEISKIYLNISLLHDQTQEHEFGCFYTMSIYKNHFKKQKYGTESV